MSRAPSAPVVDLERWLAPVHEALLGDARAAGEEIVADARRHADELVAEAEAEVDEQVAAARRRAELTERARADHELARARGDAHRAVLETERDLRERWIERVHERLPELEVGESGARLVERLEQLARQQLGDQATVERDPEGGVVAAAGGRRVDYRLSALADRAVVLLAEEAAASWA